jgi:ankyrin repeat protein
MNCFRVFFILFFIPYIIYCQENNQYSTAILNNRLLEAAYGDSLHTVAELISAGADVNAMTVEGVTALMYASQNGNIEMVNYLINSGADVNLSPENGQTALIAACRYDYLEIAEVLIRSGANIEAKDYKGLSALHYSVIYGYYYICDMLIYYDADINNCSTYYNICALSYASAFSDTNMVSLLIKKGSKIDIVDINGFSALHYATQYNQYNNVALLLNNGANPNVIDNNGVSPLFIASAFNNSDILKLFIQKGGDVSQKLSGKGKISPLKLARHYNSKKIISELKHYGVKESFLPSFTSVGLCADFFVNSRDNFSGLTISLNDVRYNMNFKIAYYTRISTKQVLENSSVENIYFQYKESRKLMIGGIGKDVLIKSKYAGNYYGIGAVAGYGVSFGKYEATTQKPEVIYRPFADLFFYKRNRALSLKAGIKYIDLKINKTYPLYLNISIGFNIPLYRGLRLKNFYNNIELI